MSSVSPLIFLAVLAQAAGRHHACVDMGLSADIAII